jgi:drug/metabolite transporter (DMT)-like permease
VLGEPITIWTIMGAGLVIISVGGVFANKQHADKKNAHSSEVAST